MDDMSPTPFAVEERVLIPVEAYISPDYARAEDERLWPKVWQVARREEELKNVGDYVTYEIAVTREADAWSGSTSYSNLQRPNRQAARPKQPVAARRNEAVTNAPKIQEPHRCMSSLPARALPARR
jgi:hypothetical protein